jgi:hypothetical protein
METLSEVETAKALMLEAMHWSVVRWLREKKKVRKTADQANAALDQFSLAIRDRWPSSLKIAYENLVAQDGTRNGKQNTAKQSSTEAGPEVSRRARTIKDAEDRAYQARMNAEETFDDAERQLSTRLAREGCVKAIQSWELKEEAIRRAEACSST